MVVMVTIVNGPDATEPAFEIVGQTGGHVTAAAVSAAGTLKYQGTGHAKGAPSAASIAPAVSIASSPPVGASGPTAASGEPAAGPPSEHDRADADKARAGNNELNRQELTRDLGSGRAIYADQALRSR
jgi:hypothetical protein